VATVKAVDHHRHRAHCRADMHKGKAVARARALDCIIIDYLQAIHDSNGLGVRLGIGYSRQRTSL
jgi:hypothetical protein